jgi:hypothetical protein
VTLAAIEKRIPHGWLVEWTTPSQGKRLLVESARGFVTIDLDRRGFRLGIVDRVEPNPTKYAGRGWIDRLVDDAVAALRAAGGCP